MDNIKNIQDAYLWGMDRLNGISQSRLTCQILLCECCHFDKQEIYIHFDDVINLDDLNSFKNCIERVLKGEPIQYILGHAAFRYLDLDVSPGVLIPRPETELLVDEVISFVKNLNSSPSLIVDLCCGSGNIAISLATELSNCHIYATDISDCACRIAKANCEKYECEDKIDIIETDLYKGIMHEFPHVIGKLCCVVSNPPYIPTKFIETLDVQVKDYEPKLALDGGEDGLDYFRNIAKFASFALMPGGFLAVELFENSLAAAKQIVQDLGFRDIETKYDLNYKPRILCAKRPLVYNVL